MISVEGDVVVRTDEVAERDVGSRRYREEGPASPHLAYAGMLTGTLIGFKEDGAVPLVLHPRQTGTGALEATSTVDLQGTHIGRQVALVFENADLRRPVIIGLLRTRGACQALEPSAQVEVDADGERLIVTAKRQLVLRCGKASITLTKAGKIVIQGSYVSNRSTGVMRIKGGSVQIN